MMTIEEMERYAKMEDKKLQEVKNLNDVQKEYVEKLKIEDSHPYISTLALETTILTINQVIDHKMNEEEILQMLEEENNTMYDLEKSFQKVGNYMRDSGPLSVPVPIQYLKARTNTLRRILQSDVEKFSR